MDFEEDAQQGPTQEQLNAVAELARQQVELEQQIEEAQQRVKDLEKQHRAIAEQKLPDLLTEAGLSTIGLSDGTQVRVDTKLYCSVPKTRKKWVADWLEQNGHGALVQEDVHVPFERGQKEQVQALVQILEQYGFDRYSVSEDVNTARLKSLLNELLEAGENPPLEEFGAYLRRSAKVA